MSENDLLNKQLRDLERREKIGHDRYFSHHYEICPICLNVYEKGEEVDIDQFSAMDFSHERKICKLCEEEMT